MLFFCPLFARFPRIDWTRRIAAEVNSARSLLRTGRRNSPENVYRNGKMEKPDKSKMVKISELTNNQSNNCQSDFCPVHITSSNQCCLNYVATRFPQSSGTAAKGEQR
ncbi:hypothetical protein D918_02883 [Trichuris suis]|nr:hypothetical protein D918_02883 [Trichuris suis]